MINPGKEQTRMSACMPGLSSGLAGIGPIRGSGPLECAIFRQLDPANRQ